MEPRTYFFRKLVDARSSLVGKGEQIKIEAAQAFASCNAAGDLRPVDDLDSIRDIAKRSAERLMSTK